MTTLSELVEQTVMHHLNSFQAADMNAVMSDYTDHSKLITPTAVLSGEKEIRQFLTELSTYFIVGESVINMEKFIVDDNLVYIVWNAKTPTLELSLASDTFIIENGKILKQTFVGIMRELKK